MLLKLFVAAIFASALPLCSPSPCISLPLWTCMDIFAMYGQFSVPAPLPVWICSCLLPLLSCMDPTPWLIGAALCCPAFFLCGPAFWLVRAAVSCAWSNHVAPPIVTSHGSVKRQGPRSTHLPACPSQSHTLEQKLGSNTACVFTFCHYLGWNSWSLDRESHVESAMSIIVYYLYLHKILLLLRVYIVNQ